MERLDKTIERALYSDPYGHRPAAPTHETSRRVRGRRRAVAPGAADRHVRRKRARLRHRGDGQSWADGTCPSQGDRRTLMAVRHPDLCGRAVRGRSADDGATDDPSSRRPHLRARSTPIGRSGPLLRTPLAGTPARAHQRLPGLPGASRRSATPAGGPTPSTRRSGKRTSSPSWTTGRSSTRSRRSQRRILERQAAPAPPQPPPVPAATGRVPQQRRAGGAPVASLGPDGSIPSLAARPLISQATSGSWERWATSLGHEHRRRRGRRTSAPVAASHGRAASPPSRKAGWRASSMTGA